MNISPLAVEMACALASGVAVFAIGLVQALVRDPDLIVPAIARADQLKVKPAGPGEFPPDLAWPFYPFRQGWADLERTRENVVDMGIALWRRPARAFFRDARGWWVLFPVPLAILSFLVMASLACAFCFMVYALVTVLCSGASQAFLVPAATMLRWAERRRRGRMQTQAACMACFHVTQWPAYQCPACLNAHHDVRPGRLGLLSRRCECGTHLPTMASRTAWRLTALCQRCETPLPTGAGAVRDIRIPVFGDISAGKTRFLYASLNSLTQTGRLDVSFPDKDSRDLAEFGLSIIRSGRETAKTSTNAQVALSFKLGKERRSEFVHLFDAAGEHFRDARRPDALRFLDDGQGLVYVLDPFSIDAIRKQFGENDATLLVAHAATGDPELTYEEVASRLRDSGIPANVQRLAVVVSKADLLRSAGLDLPSGSEAIARWLSDAGVHNLVMSAGREFAEVRFFIVASQEVMADGQDDPGAPLRWLLSAHGVRLPTDPADVAGSSDDRTTPVPSETAEARS
ncbi:MAG: hypothetical protein JO345_39065 [Streptosporangiaceae bacterium]|nr:hypothetical protein [Streptosporangiaceae bacterium]